MKNILHEMFVATVFALSLLQVSSAQYTLQIGVNGSWPISRDLTGEQVSLVCASTCVSDGCSADAQLEWLDGRVPIRQLPANVQLERSGDQCNDIITLHFLNFSVENYGRYRCRCVKQHSLNDTLSAQRHLNSEALVSYASSAVLCSNQTANNVITLWPNDNVAAIEDQAVTETARTRSLECPSGKWIIASQSEPDGAHFEQQPIYDITIKKSGEQSKLLCLHSNETLDKIFYVSIKNYDQLPFEFVRPHRDGGVVVLDHNPLSFKQPAMCVVQNNSAGVISLYIDGNEIESDENGNKNFEIAGRRVSVSTGGYRNLEWIQLFVFGAMDFSEAYSLNFSCKATSTWEEDVTVQFTLIVPPPLPPTTPPPPSCPPSSSAIHPTHSTSDIPSPTSPQPSSQSPTSITSSTQAEPELYERTENIPSPTPSQFPFLLSQSPASISALTSSSLSEDSLSTPTPELTETTPNGNSNAVVFVSTGLASLLLIAIIILLVVYICFRKCCRSSDRYRLTGLMAKEMFLELGMDLRSSESQSVDPEDLSPLSPGNNTSKQLIKCVAELEDRQWLFPYEQLEIGEAVGSGAFGVVKKAVAHNVRADGTSIVVAVKMLKEDAFDDDVKDLISELKVLQHVGAHPHIVSFLGAAIHEGSLHVIVEFCGRGSLLRYLRSKRTDQDNPLTPHHLLSMAHQVAQGMNHLASKKCIHRDLAARNVLVTEDLTFKVADFGLARKVYDSVYRPSGGRVPIKWMSLETILDREYTTQSDVWSFGILLWEIMSLGRSPYPGKSPEEVIKCIGRGFRMPAPDCCPDTVYSLMLRCWDEVPSGRPNFPELCTITEELGRDLEVAESGNQPSFDLDRSGLDETSSSRTFECSELCCYCVAEVEGAKYCQCSVSSLSFVSPRHQHGYVNRDQEMEEDAREGEGETEASKYCQCSVSSLSLTGEAPHSYVNASLHCDGEEEEMRDNYVNTANLHDKEGAMERDRTTHTSLREEEGRGRENSESQMNSLRSDSSSHLSLGLPTTSTLSNLRCKHSTSSDSYLPIVWASSDYLPMLKAVDTVNGGESLHADVESLCSMCKCSCPTDLDMEVVRKSGDNQHQVYQPKSLHRADSSLSLDSICSHGKEDAFFSAVDDQTEPRKTPNTLPLHLEQSPARPKARVEHLPSNDSGVMTMSSETTSVLDLWSQKSSVSEVVEVVSDLEEVVGSLGAEEGCGEEAFYCEETLANSQDKGVQGVRGVQRQLSAHPRFRPLFNKLGIVESDV